MPSSPPNAVSAYIGIGANLGDAQATVALAITKLTQLENSDLIRHSSPIETAPWQATGPNYINAVAEIKTGLAAHTLLQALLALENKFGRQRPYPNAPRTLDLDLLLYGSAIIQSAQLTVPHPRMHQREFVLNPLIEITPTIHIPGLGYATDLAANLSGEPRLNNFTGTA
jgi:2-amino-4-hydroxy-6-hydroxymethyldihydropteridine diphosphokinase